MIRPAVKTDASRIAEILIFTKRTAYRSIFCNDNVSFGEMQVLPLAMDFLKNDALLQNFFVYEEHFVQAIMHLNPQPQNNLGEIAELYVDPFFQNQKIGQALLSYAESVFIKQHISYIYLWVLEKNTAARHFYEKNGFMPTTCTKPEAGTPEYIVKYEKFLNC
ncbi:MAG: GNAT family N-acetyltransferase [Oscillospiraceae bacterium]|nr:GNAT family N-acetyltransferase [Oscillospiraceae bacterium]